jgi:hypothetical protein
MRILKALLALVAIVLAVFGGLFVVALIALGGACYFIARSIFGGRRAAARSQAQPPMRPSSRPGAEDAIDVVATEVPADRLER